MRETTQGNPGSLEEYITSSWGRVGSKRCDLCHRQPALLGDHFCISCRCALVERFIKTLELFYGLPPAEPESEPAAVPPRVIRPRKHRGLRSRRIRPE